MYENKTKEQLISELAEMRQQITELETSRKNMEEMLRESENRFGEIIERSVDVIYSLDVKGLVTYVSPAVERIMGYKPEEIIGKSILNYLPESEIPKAAQSLTAAIKGENTEGLEIEVLRKDGFTIIVESNTSPILRGEEVVGAQGIIRDITNRKQIEKQIQRQSAVLDAINKVFQETLTCETDEEVARMCLAVAEELTSSKFGFICEVNQAGCFDTIAISNPGWDACRISKTNAVLMLTDLEVRGIRGRVVKDERAMIFNDPASHPDRVGTPEGHPPITAFLGVPLLHVGKTIGMIGLANKESGYSIDDQQAIESLSVAFAEALNRKRIEKSMRNSEERLRNLFETMAEGVVLITPDGQIVQANLAAERILGLKRSKIESCNYVSPEWEILAPDGTPMPPEEMAGPRAMKEKRLVKDVVMGVKRPDGSISWINVSAAPLVNEDGKIEGVVGTFADITERKQAEEELHQQLAHTNLLNQITRAITEYRDLRSIFRVVLSFLEDFLQIDLGSVCFYDDVADEIIFIAYGPKTELSASGLGFPEGTAVPVEQTRWYPCLQGETWQIPDLTKVDTPTAQRFASAGARSALIIPLMVENKVIALLAVARREVDAFSNDEVEFLQQLSEHIALATYHAKLYQDLQKAYDELRQAQEIAMQQERLRALGEMASGIAHDINNALSAIIGYTELLLLDKSNLSDRARRYLETIHTAGEDTANIVSRMREFYRERGKNERLSPIDMNKIVKQAIEMTMPRWQDIPQQHGVVVKIETDLCDNLPPIMGIESEIREALVNLIINSVDAMPEGGVITMRTKVALDNVVIEVSDTGVGMDDETRRRCIEPFFTRKGEHGTGLGLAMVYGTMQRHNGKIEIESELGEGTTMRLIFSMRESKKEERRTPTGKELGQIQSLRILAIDDELSLRGLMRDILEKDGHTVELADGGQAGLDKFRAARERGAPFDVVITDLGMPYVDGRMVAQTVKREAPSTLMIMLTGWGNQLNKEGNMPLEVDALLSKPPRINEMRKALARLVSARGGDSPDGKGDYC